MPACSVPNCGNRSEKGVRLFSLPQGTRNEDRRNIWIKNINRKELPSTVFVCEIHFENDQFEINRQDGRKPLKSSAVPTIFESIDEANLKDTKTSRRSSRKRISKKYEEYDSEDEEEEEEEECDIKPPKKYISKLDNLNKKKNIVKDNNSIRCRTCLTVLLKSHGHILKKILLGRSLKETILMFVPKLAPSLSDADYICYKCCGLLLKFTRFVESCIDTDEKLKNGDISLETISSDNNKGLEKVDFRSKKVGRKRKQDLVSCQKGDLDDDLEEKNPEIMEAKRHKVPRKDSILKDKPSVDIQENKNLLSRVTDDELEIIKINNTEEVSNCTENEIIDQEKEFRQEILDNSKFEVVTDHDYIPDRRGPKVDELFHCPDCIFDYRTPKGLKHHLIQQHKIQEEQQFQCALCNMMFIRFKDMLKHKNSHGHPCDLCDEIFTNIDTLTSHKNIHPEKYCCMKCGRKFQKEDMLMKHLALHDAMVKVIVICNKSKSNLFDCNWCDMTFKYNHLLLNHIKTIHEKIKDVDCPRCEKKFSTKKIMLNHMRYTHLNNKFFKCDNCDLTFKRSDHLAEHKITHKNLSNPIRRTYSRLFNEKEKEFKCIFCSLVTITKDSLIKHLSIHANERKFECCYCGLKLTSYRTKYVHQKTHEKDEKTQFVCIVCWKRFPNEEALKIHEPIHARNLKRYECCICDASFVRKIILENHILDMHVRDRDPSTSTIDENDSSINLYETKQDIFV